jgi:hypothetical protein
MYLAPARQIGYLWLPADRWSRTRHARANGGLPPESRLTIERGGRYGLLAMGNGHAPGTATGLGAAGVICVVTGAVTGFVTADDAGRPGERRDAGLAVFFFAAFLTAGFLAGFFLAGFLPGFVLPGFFAAFFVADFLAAFADLVAVPGFFLRAAA